MKTQLRSVTLFKLKDFQPQRNRPKKPTKAGRKIQRHAKKWGDLSKKSNTSPQAGNGDKSAPGLLLPEQNTSKNNFCMRNDSGDFFFKVFFEDFSWWKMQELITGNGQFRYTQMSSNEWKQHHQQTMYLLLLYTNHPPSLCTKYSPPPHKICWY